MSRSYTKKKESLFDDKGFRIPSQGVKGEVGDINPKYAVFQPSQSLVERCERFQNVDYYSAREGYDSFEARVRSLALEVRKDSQVRNILKGVCLPLLIPRMYVEDYGATLNRLAREVKRTYDFEYPHRLPTNAYIIMEDIEGQVSVCPESRHSELLERASEGCVYALYFPQTLQGHSIQAQREQMESLPKGFLLTGGIDTAISWIMYPDVMARDERTPRYDCAALSLRLINGSEEECLYFWTCGHKAHISRGRRISGAYCGYSGGLLYIG